MHLSGIFGEWPDLHVARWESTNVTDRFEETDENEVTIIRERERFTQFAPWCADGTTSILDEGSKSHEERTASHGHFAVYQGAA